MDPWKRYRLAVCIALIVAFLAVGTFARLVWGVPEAPYGWRWAWNTRVPRTANPLRELGHDYMNAEHDRWLREVKPLHLKSLPSGPPPP